jgi:ParB-like chromosome segregation protein Spo0J
MKILRDAPEIKPYNCEYGFRRLAACTKLGYKFIQARDVDTGEVINVPIKDINSKNNLRLSSVEDPKLAEMMTTIRERGLFQAIGVQKSKNEGGISHIINNLVENLQRQDPHIFDFGMACKRLGEEFDMSVDEIASSLGINPSRIKDALEIVSKFNKDEIADIEFDVERKNKAGKISIKAAQVIANSTARQSSRVKKEFLKAAKKENLNVSEINHVANLIKSGLDVDAALHKRKDVSRRTMNIPFNTTEFDKRKLSKQGTFRQHVFDILIKADPTLFKI